MIHKALWTLLAMVALVGAAIMFRYEPMNGGTYVWDRWLGRACVAVPAGEAVYCSAGDLPNRAAPPAAVEPAN